jgi:uncharacterized protein
MTQLALHDGLCATSWRSRPGDFVSLMTLYESNYIRLRSLAGDLFALSDTQISTHADDCPLHLRVTERSPYTLTVILTYEFVENGEPIADPNLQVRVYRDAKLAEAMSCAGWHRHSMLSAWRDRLTRNANARWQRNMMLNKWLEYCVDRGHRFVRAPSVAG